MAAVFGRSRTVRIRVPLGEQEQVGILLMRILYVCTYYHRAMVFRDSMNYLEARGNSVLAFNAVAVGAKVDEKYTRIMDDKVVHKECFGKLDRFFFRRKQKKIREAIEKNVKLTDFDLIHSHTLFNGGWATYQLHKRYGIPYVVSVRNTDLNVFMKIPVFKSIARKILDNASGVLFLSEAYKEKLLSTCYRRSGREAVIGKCDVIPNGLEPYWLDHVSSGKESVHDPLELLCVGKVDKNKNMETTLKVVDQLNAAGLHTHLTVIGQVLDEAVKTMLDNGQNVSVIPYLTKEELIGYYRAADVFVMPSFKETFGRVYAEAMTQGVPVIYTRGQGFDGTFEDGAVGYSVKADDVDEIISSIRKIIENYGAISANCIDQCRIFNWHDISERLERLYERAIERTET